jgi:hypothetical protein
MDSPQTMHHGELLWSTGFPQYPHGMATSDTWRGASADVDAGE